MKSTLLILYIFISCISYSQEPTLQRLKGIGGSGIDQSTPFVIKTNDAGFITCLFSSSNTGTGSIDSFCLINEYRTIFIKYNSDASIVEWSKCYENNGDSFTIYLFPTNDGGVVLGGQFKSASGYGFLIWKEDILGNILWSHNYSKGNGPLLRNMISTADGGFLMTGDIYYTDTNFTVHNSGSLGADIGVIKLDNLGNKQWSKTIGGSQDEMSKAAIQVSG